MEYDTALEAGLRAVREAHHVALHPNDPVPMVATATAAAVQAIEPKVRRNLRIVAFNLLAIVIVLLCLISYQLGLSQGAGRQALLETQQGKAAMELAELGVALELLHCKGPGWRAQDGRCFATPLEGRVFGWRVK